MDHVSELLSPYLDGQTSLPELQAVEAHLGECDACRAELADLRALKGLLAQLPDREPPRSFALGPRSLRSSALSGTFGGFLRAATSVAASLAVVAVGASLILHGPPRQSATAAPAAVAASSPFSLASPASNQAPEAAKPAAALAAPAAQAPVSGGSAPPPGPPTGGASPAAQERSAPGSPPSPVGAAGGVPAAAPSRPTGQVSAARGTTVSPERTDVRSAAPTLSAASNGSGLEVAAAPPPVNVPRLAGELLLLSAALGLAAYSVRWWRR